MALRNLGRPRRAFAPRPLISTKHLYPVKKLLLLLVILMGSLSSNAQELVWPDHVIASVPAVVQVSCDDCADTLVVEVNGKAQLVPLTKGKGSFEIVLEKRKTITVFIGRAVFERKFNPVPLGWSIWPPLIAIVMALLFREVYSALFAGILMGAWLLGGYNYGLIPGMWWALQRIADTYIIEALSDPDHQSIVVFSMLIGGMVAVISKNGGMQGVVNYLSRFAKNARSGQMVTWFLGVLIFFDDYSNTLLVGNTMRPVTDKLRISREKLAYLVDSTAAPVAAIAFITTWIGAELGYIKDGIAGIDGLDENAYHVFLNSLQYSFYPILTLLFMLMLIWQGRDFGPMRDAEVAARARGALIPTGINKLQGEAAAFNMEHGLKPTAGLAILPVLAVVGVVIYGLITTGWDEAVWLDTELSIFRRLSIIIGNANSYTSLLWGSGAGLLLAIILSIGTKRLSLEKSMESMLTGFKTMLAAVLILVLAWILAELTQELHTAVFITRALLDLNLGASWLPLLTFLLAGLVAFSTGSSWGTMAILYPIMLPAAWKLAQEAGMSHEQGLAIFHNVVSCVLAGSVLGDHCSPISDTTILSSLASGCNHISHVRTQMPYALTVGSFAILFGTIPVAFGMPFWMTYVLVLPAMWYFIRYFGAPVPQ